VLFLQCARQALAEFLQETRQALNEMSERLVSLGDGDGSFDALLLKVMNQQNWS